MADQKLLMQTLSEFASTLVQDFTISDVLHDLAERVIFLPPAFLSPGGWSGSSAASTC